MNMKKVRIVDDESLVIRVLKRALEKEGYSVSDSRNGEDALKAIKTETPDVLITDVQMPKMDGIELCERIKLDIPDREFLLIVSTSRPENEIRAWAEEIGNLVFIEKPVSIKKLIALLESHFLKEKVV